MLQVIEYDIETVEASHHDTMRLSDQYGLDLKSVAAKAKATTREEMKTGRMFTSLYIPGLFIGTIGFFGATSIKQWRSRKATRKSSNASPLPVWKVDDQVRAGSAILPARL